MSRDLRHYEHENDKIDRSMREKDETDMSN